MAIQIPDKLYFKIGEVSRITDVEPYILRYWESEFTVIKPYRTKSNQRLYRKKDVEIILKIKEMLYDNKYTIAGAKKRLREKIPQKKQLPLEFTHKQYRETLLHIREQLADIVETAKTSNW